MAIGEFTISANLNYTSLDKSFCFSALNIKFVNKYDI